jgi:hypothetical protein
MFVASIGCGRCAEAEPYAAKLGSREMAKTHFPSLIHWKREEEKQWKADVKSKRQHAQSITSPHGAINRTV